MVVRVLIKVRMSCVRVKFKLDFKVVVTTLNSLDMVIMVANKDQTNFRTERSAFEVFACHLIDSHT